MPVFSFLKGPGAKCFRQETVYFRAQMRYNRKTSQKGEIPLPKEDDFEDLMRQVDALLEEPIQVEEGPDVLPVFHREAPVQNFANGYGKDQADSMPREETSLPGYNPDFQMRSVRPYGGKPQEAPETPRPPKKTKPRKGKTKKEKKPVEKSSHPLRNALIVLVLLAAALGLCLVLLPEAPQTERPLGLRKDGACTVLLCGTDAEGTRTDTMMLLYVNPKAHELNLVSLPRDTLTYTAAGNYAKLNSAFGRNNGGEDPAEGMNALMDYVADIVGFRPDGYMLVDLDCFVEAVDTMGGVDFDVPQDMYYADPSQDLLIDLQAGYQHLNGREAMGLVRFRKGYSTQDLGRVEVQREFITACMKQWLTPAKAFRLPGLLHILAENSTTDLTLRNYLYLGLGAWRSGFGNMQTATLPGYADMVEDASVYVLYPYDTADLVNAYCNPYIQKVDRANLNIAQ